MLFNSLNKKLKKSYEVINKDVSRYVFPKGESEYIYVGNMLDNLFKKNDVFELMKIYVSVYTFYKTSMGNIYNTFMYAKKKANPILSDWDVKDLIALIVLNITATENNNFPDPLAAVKYYREMIDLFLKNVTVIEKNKWRYEPKTVTAGTHTSPLLVNGVDGVKSYIDSLNIPNIESITYKRGSTLNIADPNNDITFAIDEYILYDEKNSQEIARLWFNIYGTENTEVQPACFSGKMPFNASKVSNELFETSVKQTVAIKNLCDSNNLDYNYSNLVMNTLAYFFQIWSLSFTNLRLGQSDELEELFVSSFINFNKTELATESYAQVVENEKEFPEIIKKSYKFVKGVYDKNNKTIVDDGITEDLLNKIVVNKEDIVKIKHSVSKIIAEEWVALGREADEKYLT